MRTIERFICAFVCALSIATAVSTCGCSTRKVTYLGVEYESNRFLMKENFKEVSISTNGTLKIEGYQSDQVEALKAGIELGKSLRL